MKKFCNTVKYEKIRKNTKKCLNFVASSNAAKANRRMEFICLSKLYNKYVNIVQKLAIDVILYIMKKIQILIFLDFQLRGKTI